MSLVYRSTNGHILLSNPHWLPSTWFNLSILNGEHTEALRDTTEISQFSQMPVWWFKLQSNPQRRHAEAFEVKTGTRQGCLLSQLTVSLHVKVYHYNNNNNLLCLIYWYLFHVNIWLFAHFSEQPIFTTRVHVFQIDPDTKKKWLPVSSQPVPVSFYHDTARSSYRIISLDGSKVCGWILPCINIHHGSCTFGLWLNIVILFNKPKFNLMTVCAYYC